MTNPLGDSLHLFDFFTATPDLVCIAGKDGYLKKVNPAVTEKLGYSAEELYSMPVLSLVHPDDRNITSERRKELLEGRALLNFVNRYVTKSGAVVWLEWTSVYFMEKEVVFAIAKDVTQRKLAEKNAEEQYRKFKSLASHFKNSIEKDRKYLAYELHEELAQLVAAVRMDIEIIARRIPPEDELHKTSIEHAMAISGLLLRSIQRIAFAISPRMMEEFGLDKTMEWLCREFSILNGIPCIFQSRVDDKLLSEEMKTDFFRICQEALMNVADYAKADNVRVSITETAGSIELSVVDDGRGFEVDQQIATLGFTSMRQRAASINGELTIHSKPGKGTSIKVKVDKLSKETGL